MVIGVICVCNWNIDYEYEDDDNDWAADEESFVVPKRESATGVVVTTVPTTKQGSNANGITETTRSNSINGTSGNALAPATRTQGSARDVRNGACLQNSKPKETSLTSDEEKIKPKKIPFENKSFKLPRLAIENIDPSRRAASNPELTRNSRSRDICDSCAASERRPSVTSLRSLDERHRNFDRNMPLPKINSIHIQSDSDGFIVDTNQDTGRRLVLQKSSEIRESNLTINLSGDGESIKLSYVYEIDKEREISCVLESDQEIEQLLNKLETCASGRKND